MTHFFFVGILKGGGVSESRIIDDGIETAFLQFSGNYRDRLLNLFDNGDIDFNWRYIGKLRKNFSIILAPIASENPITFLRKKILLHKRLSQKMLQLLAQIFPWFLYLFV